MLSHEVCFVAHYVGKMFDIVENRYITSHEQLPVPLINKVNQLIHQIPLPYEQDIFDELLKLLPTHFVHVDNPSVIDSNQEEIFLEKEQLRVLITDLTSGKVKLFFDADTNTISKVD